MGNIRKQTILSSIVIYIGFIIGFINTYLYVKNGTFTTEQYGLTRLFNDIGITFFSFATFGILSYIYKFQPYYKQNLSKEENDQVALSTVVVTVGFIFVVIGSILLKPLFIRKFSAKSSLLITYYYWILPYTFGILFFTLFEAFAWFAQKSIFTNFLKETGIRILQLLIILLFVFHFISFDTFIKGFSITYPCVAAFLLIYLIYNNYVEFNFRVSRVTKKFSKKIITLMLLIYGSLIVNTIAQYIDSIIIASVSVRGLSDVGVYTLAGFIATTMMVPQRSIIAATIPALSLSWKKKDYNEINRIYSRTSINLLLMSLLIFFVIWLSINDFFVVFHINKDYEAGKMVILLLAIRNIIDAGTGVNSQIIGTSNFWRFEVLTGIFLLSISIPLNYFLVKRMGINGSALSNLIAYTLYNAIRLFFIWYKFKMQPFSLKTIYALVVSALIYLLVYMLLHQLHGLAGIAIRSVLFVALFGVAVISLRISPDATHFYFEGLKRFKRKNE